MFIIFKFDIENEPTLKLNNTSKNELYMVPIWDN